MPDSGCGGALQLEACARQDASASGFCTIITTKKLYIILFVG
jgi:hypothetical protein